MMDDANAVKTPSRAIERNTARDDAMPALTGLRAVAALAVLVAHGAGQILKFQSASFNPVYWLEQCSGFGMTLFFVLSGFVIHYNYRIIVTQNRIAGTGWFIWARFARLYPLFFLILTIDILFGRSLYKYLAGVTPNDIHDVVAALPYYITFTQSWVYVPFEQNSLIYAIGPASALTWSISTEWFFYLSYPLFAGLLLQLRRPGMTVLAIIAFSGIPLCLATGIALKSAAINQWAMSNYGDMAGVIDGQAATWQDAFLRWLIYFSPYARVSEFILGCLTCQLYLVTRERPLARREYILGRILTGVAIISVPVATYVLFMPRSGGGTWLGAVLVNLSNNFGQAPTAALLIFCLARYPGTLARLLGSAPMVGIGEASYSIYLIHFPILAMISSYLGYNLPYTIENIAFQFARLTLLITIIIGISLAVSTYIEAPSRRWMRRLWSSTVETGRWKEAISVLSAPGIAAVALILLIAPSRATPPNAAAGGGIHVIEATYGRNCGARVGNATTDARKLCDGLARCDYVVDVERLGDPAGGCSKDFRVTYSCQPQARPARVTLPGEAGLQSRLRLDCPPSGQSAAGDVR